MAPPVARNLLITNATIWTLAGDNIENGTVVVSDGKIRAVGSDVRIPDGAEIIDADGGAVIPGIIDAHSHLAIEGGETELVAEGEGSGY